MTDRDRERERERGAALVSWCSGALRCAQVLSCVVFMNPGSSSHSTPLAVTVLYGSETGNAEELAEEVGRLLERKVASGRRGREDDDEKKREKRVFRVSCVSSCEAFDVRLLPSLECVVFVTSTTGQGDPPRNLIKFWRFLRRKSLPPSSLHHLKYAVFGLGDSTYPKFNVVARRLFMRLEALGGTPLVPLRDSLGDDQHPRGGYFHAFDLWYDKLVVELSRYANEINGGNTTSPSYDHDDRDEARVGNDVELINNKDNKHFDGLEDQPKVVVEKVSPPQGRCTSKPFDIQYESNLCYRILQSAFKGQPPPLQDRGVGAAAGAPATGAPVPYCRGRPFFAQLKSNPLALTSEDHFQDVRSVQLVLDESMRYQPGDALAVLPSQRRDLVDKLLERMGCHYDEWVRVKSGRKGPNQHFQSAGTESEVEEAEESIIHLGTLFNYCLDGTSASPRSYFFYVASHFASDDLEREKLKELGSREGRDDFYQYCTRERRSVLECFQDFPSLDMPLDWVVQLCPKLQARQFSISSSCNEVGERNECELTVAVVNYKTPWKRSISGLCSNYLKDLPFLRTKGETSAPNPVRVPVWIERGSFKFSVLDAISGNALHSQREEHSAIIIGPGTGIAPFKSLVEHLMRHKERLPQKSRLLVFFGCRKRESDYLHQSFWMDCVKSSDVFALPGGFVSAFSRDQVGEKLSHNSDGTVAVEKLEKSKASSLPSFSTSNKYYVQDAIESCSAQVYDLLHLRGARVYVAGSTGQMPKDVRQALVHVMVKHGGMLHNQADEYVKRMEKVDKYQVEAWG